MMADLNSYPKHQCTLTCRVFTAMRLPIMYTRSVCYCTNACTQECITYTVAQICWVNLIFQCFLVSIHTIIKKIQPKWWAPPQVLFIYGCRRFPSFRFKHGRRMTEIPIISTSFFSRHITLLSRVTEVKLQCSCGLKCLLNCWIWTPCS
jgi:hypothetical protein